MQVNLYSNLRKIAGRDSIILSVDESLSLHQILVSLAQEFPEFERMFFDQEGAFSAQMPIFLNGRNPRLFPDGLHTKVLPTDVLSLFTPLSSGKLNVEVLKQVAESTYLKE